MFVTLGGDRQGRPHVGRANDDDGAPRLHDSAPTRPTSGARPRTPTSSSASCSTSCDAAANGGETLVVLTADHGATYGENFYGKRRRPRGDSNWYYAPTRVERRACLDDATHHPSPALQPLLDTGNLQFSYQSTAIEAWLTNHSPAPRAGGRRVMQTLPGVIATLLPRR